MRYLVGILALLCALSCEGQIPYSAVDGPLVPAGVVAVDRLQLPTGRLSSMASGQNAAITGSNMEDFCNELLSLLIVTSNQAIRINSVPGTTEPDYRVVDNGSTVLRGIFEGQVDKDRRYVFTGYFVAELLDWTILGEQYFGGGLAYDLTYRNWLMADDAFSVHAQINGKLELGGKYRGTVSFQDFDFLWGAWVTECKGNILVNTGGVETLYYVEKKCNYGNDVGCGWIIE